ncbi:hypothetical protein Tco_1446092, partial [Tanacetum coccineum]
MPRNCLRIIESKSKVRNSRNKPVVAKVSSSSSTPGISPDVVELKDMVKALVLDKKSQAPTLVKAVEESCVLVVIQPPAYQDLTYQASAPQIQGVSKEDFQAYVKANDAVMRNMQTQGSGTLPSNTITNTKEDLKGITTRSGAAYKGPTIPTTSPKEWNVRPSAPMPNQKTSIPFPSRRNDERRREKANDQIQKFYKIFRDLSFEISFTDALMLMPKFASTLKALIRNKEKFSEMARTPLNENCLAVILNKLPKKLRDPGRFLIPCEFSGINTCNALADLGSSKLTPTCMTLELADHSISELIGIAEDVYTSRALIDVYEGEITLRLGREAITFNLDQTSRYTNNYNHMTVNRIDVIEMACEEYSQEVLGFSNEADPFLAIEDDPTSPEVDPTYYDPDGDILLLEAILNSDPSPPPPNQGSYLPEFQKDLKICEANNEKCLVNEPPEVELKDLSPHLEYAFLEGNDKLPVIIAKDLKNEEKAALIEVLKSHKRAIAWKLLDIKGIDPEFCTHKIIIEEDYEPTVQHQRRVNQKIHDVIKKEVEKLL